MRIAALSVLLTFQVHPAVGASPSGQEANPVVLERSPPSLQKHYFEDSPWLRGSAKLTPRTKWSFPFHRPQVSFDIVSDAAAVQDKIQVKITGVKMKLSLPMVMLISKSAKQDTLEHEMGHVLICTRAYSRIASQIDAYARQLIGKTYAGRGKDTTSACQAAVDQPLDALSRKYISLSQEVNKISQRYDLIYATNPRISIKTAIKMAETAVAAKNDRERRGKDGRTQ